jgi:hypothetical protein
MPLLGMVRIVVIAESNVEAHTLAAPADACTLVRDIHLPVTHSKSTPSAETA